MILTVTPKPAIDITLEVEDFRPGSVCLARRILEQPAGKGINVSLCLSALDTASRAVSIVGQADLSTFEEQLSGTKVEGVFVTGPFRTRRNTTLLDRRSGTDTHICERGPAIMEREVAALEKAVLESSAPGDIVVFAGGLPPGFGSDRFAELVRRCAVGGRITVVDADREPLRRAMRWAWMVKPNLEELGRIAGKGDKWAQSVGSSSEYDLTEQLASAVEAIAAPVVCVTCGELGAVLFTRGTVWRAQAGSKGGVLRNTRGAGDAFLAGYLAAHSQGEEPDVCLLKAVACATASCLTVGTAAFDTDTARKIEKEVSVAIHE